LAPLAKSRSGNPGSESLFGRLQESFLKIATVLTNLHCESHPLSRGFRPVQFEATALVPIEVETEIKNIF